MIQNLLIHVHYLLISFFLVTRIALGQGAFGETPHQKSEYNLSSAELNISPYIQGTLLIPEPADRPNLVIIIPGSGPTDRNGNQPMMNNNALKFLAQGLQEQGIASFRYDKRIVPLVKQGNFQEENVAFDDFILDAREVLNYFINTNAFNKIFIAGHSQGSLVGMIAAKDGADGFISIAGAGQSIDQVVLDQLALQLPSAVPAAEAAFNKLKNTGKVEDYPAALGTIFRPSIQRFMAEWMSYDPGAILSSLDLPKLILNGTSDLQVFEQEALLLKKAAPSAQLKVIVNMNHVLKIIKEKGLANGKSYNDPNLPVSEELISTMASFINQNS